MEVTKLTFQADEQNLVKASGTDVFASDTVSYIEADFTLGTNWTGYDSVRAMWKFGSDVYATVLDSDGKCIVPHEVLTKRGELKVNLVGSISENGVLTDRLTTFPILALVISKIAQVEGDNSTAPTASEYEQFVEVVHEDAERAVQAKTDAESARDLAQTYASNAEGSATASADSASSASQSATQAQGSASASTTSATNAEQSERNAKASELASAQSESNALAYAQRAESAESGAESAKEAIENMTATASVTNTVGTPSVVVTKSQVGDHVNLDYAFENLKGETGSTGERGEKGDKGDKGDTGATPDLQIGTVETLAPTEQATASITGTPENPILNLGIPQGETGEVDRTAIFPFLPTDTAQGEIASFTDGANDVPVEDLVVDIEPVQSGSGDPSPTNIRPISGWTGAVVQRTGINVWDEEWESGALDASGNPTGANAIRSKNFIPVKGGATYFEYASDNTSNWINISQYDADKVFIQQGAIYSKRTITLEPNTAYIKFYMSSTYGTTYNNDISINYPSTGTSYHPYQGQTYPITFPTEAGTVYSGTLDVVSGELTVTHGIVDLGSQDWSYRSGVYFQTGPKTSIGAATSSEPICSAYKFITSSSFVNGAFYEVSNYYRFFNSAYSDATAFKESVNGVQLCYKLATPQTYQLTPTEVRTLLGDNNIWADTGASEVTYRADIQKYIDKQISAVLNA